MIGQRRTDEDELTIAGAIRARCAGQRE